MSRLLRMWIGFALTRRNPRIIAQVAGSSILSSRMMKKPLARRRDVFLSGIKAFSSRS